MTRTLTTERQQFEQWWETAMHNGYPPRFGWEHWRDGDGYRDDDGEFHGLWQAWQVSRGFLANREAQPVQVTDGMALDFHRALTDSDMGKDDLEEIKVGLRAALCNVTAPPAPAVPGIDELRLTFERAERESDDGFNLHKYGIGYADEATQARWESWLSCRAAMLAQPVSSGYKLPEGWIACSEKMPTPFVDVIASDGKQTFTAHFIDEADWWCLVSQLAEEPGDVTHWMPLPAAPEGGN